MGKSEESEWGKVGESEEKWRKVWKKWRIMGKSGEK